MQVNEQKARQMFKAMGLNESKWNAKFLTKKLNAIIEMVESATAEPEGEDLSLLRRVTEAAGAGEKITLEGSEETVSTATKEKPTKAGKGKGDKPSKKAEAAAGKKTKPAREAGTPSNKEVVYKAWKKSKEKADPEKLVGEVNEAVKLTTVRGWLSAWKRGENLPACAGK
jgi:hypothetical protein